MTYRGGFTGPALEPCAQLAPWAMVPPATKPSDATLDDDGLGEKACGESSSPESNKGSSLRAIACDRGISGLISDVADNAGGVFLGFFARSYCIRYNNSYKSDFDLLRNVTLETRSRSSLLVPSLRLLSASSSSLSCVELSLRNLRLSNRALGRFNR